MLKTLTLYIFLVLLLSCKENQKSPPSNSYLETLEENQKPEKLNKKISGCYIYAQDSSYVEMKIINEGELIKGKLKYSLFEKDANQGFFEGRISNNILIANYTFESEGIESTRQIAFLIKNNQLIEGFGEVKVDDKYITFKNIENLNFSSNIVLEKSHCNTLKN